MPINVIVDISHHNGNVDLNKAQQAGIAGVIHKGTQGTGMFDRSYTGNRQKAEAAGLMWGAYHFGTKGDGAAQADFFLSKINADEQTLLVLDYEPNGLRTMTLDQARAFVTRVNAVTGRFPGLYSGNLIKEQLRSQPVDPGGSRSTYSRIACARNNSARRATISGEADCSARKRIELSSHCASPPDTSITSIDGSASSRG